MRVLTSATGWIFGQTCGELGCPSLYDEMGKFIFLMYVSGLCMQNTIQPDGRALLFFLVEFQLQFTFHTKIWSVRIFFFLLSKFIVNIWCLKHNSQVIRERFHVPFLYKTISMPFPPHKKNKHIAHTGTHILTKVIWCNLILTKRHRQQHQQ